MSKTTAIICVRDDNDRTLIRETLQNQPDLLLVVYNAANKVKIVSAKVQWLLLEIDFFPPAKMNEILLWGKKMGTKITLLKSRNRLYFSTLYLSGWYSSLPYSSSEFHHFLIQQYREIVQAPKGLKYFNNQLYSLRGKSFLKIAIQKIQYVTIDVDVLVIVHENGRSKLPGTLREIEQLLTNWEFIRIHRSFLVALDFIASIDTNFVVMRDGQHIPMSKSGKNYLKAYFQ